MKACVDRRSVLAGIAVLLGGCATQRGTLIGAAFYPLGNADFAAYGPKLDHGHEIPALDLTQIDPSLLRQQVGFAGLHRQISIRKSLYAAKFFLNPFQLEKHAEGTSLALLW